MTQKFLLPIVGVALSVALSSCATTEQQPAPLKRGGYSLDQPAGRNQSPRYQENRVADAPASSSEKPMDYVAPEESAEAPPELAPAPASTPGTSDSAVSSGPVVETPKVEAPPAPVTPPPPAPKPNQPAYATPVIGKRGYVYPPGVEAKPENMVDVRDYVPGQKVRDPRSGNIFLVP